MGRLRVELGLLVGVTALLLAPVGAPASSLYHGPPPRPGPEILYRKPAEAPQLRNEGV